MMSHSNRAEKSSSPQTEFSLNCATIGNKLTVVSIDSQNSGRASAVRLMELGLVPGIEVELISTSYGLARIKLRGAEFSIRLESAEDIRVKLSS